MEKRNLCTKYRVCAIFGLCLSTLGVIVLKYIIPSIVDHHILKRIALKDGWAMRKAWSKLPFPYEFHAHVFNVTNPDEIIKGDKPILMEVGPFVYDVWQKKINIVDHEEDDTLSYTMKKTFFFNAVKSHPLSDNDELTLAHYMILGVPNTILKTRPTILPLVSKSIDSLYNSPKSPFVKVKVKTFIYDGYEINCEGVEEFFAKVICNDIKEFWFDYRIMKIRENFYTTSLMGTFNDTVAWTGPSRINRGINNTAEIGKFIQYNNTNNFAKWNDEKCDTFVGTDGTMFHPHLRRNEILHVVNTWLSRSFTYHYDSDVKHGALKCFRYTTTLGTDLETNPDDKCYCIAPDHCLKNGVFEVMKSLNWGLVASNPHFYLADPYYNERVIGLKPDKEKHMSTIDVDPLTGSVVSANFRLQFSAQLTKQPKYRLFKNISEALLPYGWYEERFMLPENAIESLKSFSNMIVVEKLFTYMIIACGLILFGIGIGFEIMKLKQSNS